jgi:hypothetical protein
MDETGSRTSWKTRLLAVVVLAAAAWILFKIVIGTIMAIVWTAAAIAAVVAILWAVRALR